MQRGFGGNFCLQNAKIKHSKILEKSMNFGQNKNFFKILKKSVAKIVRFFGDGQLGKYVCFRYYLGDKFILLVIFFPYT